MARMLCIAILSVALASTAGAVKASAAHPLESLAVTASSLGQKALDDPACFALVESLITEIGQRLAGTEAHKRAVAWAEAEAESRRLRERALRAIHPPCPCGNPGRHWRTVLHRSFRRI